MFYINFCWRKGEQERGEKEGTKKEQQVEEEAVETTTNSAAQRRAENKQRERQNKWHAVGALKIAKVNNQQWFAEQAGMRGGGEVCSQAMAAWKVSGRQWLVEGVKNEIRVKAAPAGETVA